jgi:hypothetical protein
MRQPLFAAVLASALTLAACGESENEGPTMSPGSDCLSCHTGGDAPRFTAAGTVYPAGDAASGIAGVTVTLTGSGGGQTVTLTTNSAGNFYTSAALTAPIDVVLDGNGGTVTMVNHNPGDCGSCHAPPAGNGGAPMRVHVGTCADCH